MNELDRLPKILRFFFISRTFKTSFFQNRLYTKELTPDTFYFFQNQYSILFKINTRGTVSHFAGSFLKENEVSWRSIFYSISSTRISIKSALLGSNLYYYFTVGKARIRLACNFVIMVIMAGPDPFQGLEPQISYVSHYRFDQGHLAYEYSPALESVSLRAPYQNEPVGFTRRPETRSNYVLLSIHLPYTSRR